MTPEEYAALIEIQRQAYLTDKNPRNQQMAPLLPPTKFSVPAGSGENP